MELKAGVRIGGVKAHTVLAMILVNDALKVTFPYIPMVVTSCLRYGADIGAGLHGTGDALDIRTHHYFQGITPSNRRVNLDLLVRKIKDTLGNELDVILEYPNEANEHIHIELDPD